MTYNWCIKIEALYFHCKNNLEGHIEGISENDMKKTQIWRKWFQVIKMDKKLAKQMEKRNQGKFQRAALQNDGKREFW